MWTNILGSNSDMALIKYADDMALVACLEVKSISSYSQFIDCLLTWFDSSVLDLNVTKNKKLCLGGNQFGENGSPSLEPVTM